MSQHPYLRDVLRKSKTSEVRTAGKFDQSSHAENVSTEKCHEQNVLKMAQGRSRREKERIQIKSVELVVFKSKE